MGQGYQPLVQVANATVPFDDSPPSEQRRIQSKQKGVFGPTATSLASGRALCIKPVGENGFPSPEE